jgi:predicted porin
MKKSLFALAMLGVFAGVTHAENSIQIYGVIDSGVRNVTIVNGVGNNRTTMSSTGTFNSNRIGFKGIESLGSGLDAHFVLENGFNVGTGTLNNAANRLFERSAYVGLGNKSWGSLDLGRQYNLAFQTIAAYDPFAYKYPAIASAVAATAGLRFDNDIQYKGIFGPVLAGFEYAFGETSAFNTGSSKSIGAGYNAGPLAIGAAYTLRNIAGFNNKHWTAGAAYQSGAARVAAGYVDQKQERGAAADARTKWAWLGASYAINPAIEFTGAYYRTKQDGAANTAPAAGAIGLPAFTGEGKKDLYMLGATYALSKRTNFYAEIDYSKLSNGLIVAAPQDRQRGISAGINHLF